MKGGNTKVFSFFISIIFSLANHVSDGQDFATNIDKISKTRTIAFADMRTPPRIPILVTKSSSVDSASISDEKIEIGLYIIINLVRVDYFMYKGGFIVFEDNTSLRLDDEISKILLSGGKHQIAIKHVLTKNELKYLQTKKIDYFTIGNIKKPIESFERDFLRSVFVKIELE